MLLGIINNLMLSTGDPCCCVAIVVPFLIAEVGVTIAVSAVDAGRRKETWMHFSSRLTHTAKALILKTHVARIE